MNNKGIVKVNDIINGFPTPYGVHKWARNLRVVELDFPFAEGKGVRAVNERGTTYAFKYDEFEIVQRAEATTTGRVNATWSGFKVGDTVVEIVNGGADVIVERKVPVKPAEPAFGHGTAYVHATVATMGGPQKRYRGFKSQSGKFYFLGTDNMQRMAGLGQYEGFRLDEG